GDFKIVAEIGRGGMGIVYEAVEQSLRRRVALKVMSTTGLLNPHHLERFRLEARAAARLSHNHIVPVYGVGQCNGLHYYVMQFIDGQNLDAVINWLRRSRQAKQNSGFVLQTSPAAQSTGRGEKLASSPDSPPTGTAAETTDFAASPTNFSNFSNSSSGPEF